MRRRLAIILAAVCGIFLALFLLRAPLLRSAADLWIVNQPVSQGDGRNVEC